MGRKKKNSSEQMHRRTQEEIFGIVNAANASAAAAPTLDAAKVESEFADILNYQRKQENNLLGTFVGKKYKISDVMIARLLALPKKFDRIENNILYAATILGEFVLNFKIEMDIQPDYCKGKLFLIEIEQDVEVDIKHLTLLDEVTEPYMFEFRNFLCQKWNIFYDDQVVDKGDAIYKYLHMQNEEFLFNRELVEILSQLYVVRMLAFLEGMGELGQKTQYEFKLLMEKRLATDPSLAQNFTLQKHLLDFVLKKNNAIVEVLKTEEGMKVLSGFSKPLVNIRDKTYPTILENKKEEKKAEKAASKPAAKAKKKGGASKGPSGGAVDPWKGYKATVVGGVSFASQKKETKEAQLKTSQPAVKMGNPKIVIEKPIEDISEEEALAIMRKNADEFKKSQRLEMEENVSNTEIEKETSTAELESGADKLFVNKDSVKSDTFDRWSKDQQIRVEQPNDNFNEL